MECRLPCSRNLDFWKGYSTHAVKLELEKQYIRLQKFRSQVAHRPSVRGRNFFNGIIVVGYLSAMPENSPLTIVNVGYLSTNYWVVSAGRSRLLVDLGYPGTMGTMRARLKQMDIPLKEIRYALATHYHIDHAGLAQELKLAGVSLLVLDVQVSAIPLMKQFTKPRDHYVDILLGWQCDHLQCREPWHAARTVGIQGEVLPTPGSLR